MEAELYRGTRCWSCELAALVDRILTDPATGTMSSELVLVADALKSMKRPNSGVTWIRQPRVTTFLQLLAREPTVTHQVLDQVAGAPAVREHVRGLLVEHGALPRRDELAIRYDAWATEALERVHGDAHRDVARRYIRWYHQRRMNQMEKVASGTYERAKQSVTVAIEFLNWLHDQSVALGELRQVHLDEWLATGPSTRRFVDRFIPWAIKSKLVQPDLVVPAHRRGTSHQLSSHEQGLALDRVVHSDELPARDRAAAILVIVFGQQVEDVVKLTWDDIKVTDDIVTVRLGRAEFALPSPLDEPMRELAARPGHDLTASHPNSNWVFRGGAPGQHIRAITLRERLKSVFSTRAARLGTLHELTKLGPLPIIAEALGYHPTTLERHARGSASTYAEYVSARKKSG